MKPISIPEVLPASSPIVLPDDAVELASFTLIIYSSEGGQYPTPSSAVLHSVVSGYFYGINLRMSYIDWVDVPAGIYDLYVTASGYEDYEIEEFMVTGDDNTNPNPITMVYIPE